MSKQNGHRLMEAIWTVVREDKIDVMWHGMGRLLDGLRARPQYANVVEYLERKLRDHEMISRSSFIRATFEYLKDERVVESLRSAQEANREESVKRREAGGGPFRAPRPEVRKRPVR